MTNATEIKTQAIEDFKTNNAADLAEGDLDPMIVLQLMELQPDDWWVRNADDPEGDIMATMIPDLDDDEEAEAFLESLQRLAKARAEMGQ